MDFSTIDTSFPDGLDEAPAIVAQRAVCRDLFRQVAGMRGRWPDEVVDWMLERIYGLVPVVIEAPLANTPPALETIAEPAPKEVAPALAVTLEAEASAALIIARAREEAAKIVAAAQAAALEVAP